MAVILKRTGNYHGRIPQECPYGCCTPIHGKDTRKVRRSIKRAENALWRKNMDN